MPFRQPKTTLLQPETILTLSAGSFRPLLAAKHVRCPNIFRLPEFVATDLRLRGLCLPTDMLSGFGLKDIEKLRDEADRAQCPVLLLSEETAIDFTERGENFAKAIDRIGRLGLAASKLGCPSLAVRAAAPDTDEAFEKTAQGVKQALKAVERYEIIMLLAPHAGVTEQPQRLTELIKKIGGFRIGSFPSFAHAAASDSLEQTLRKLAPYAPAIAASIRGFGKDGAHEGFSLEACIESISSVGYSNMLALDYVGPDAAAGDDAAKSSKKKPAKKAAASDVADDLDALVAVLDRARQALEAASAALVPEDEEE